MKVYSSALNGGIIPDKYGKRGDQFNSFGVPSCSVPVEITDAPENTVCFALLLEDKDAVPVCGFSWIHWVAANIKRTSLPENDSVTAADYVQGINSWLGTYGREGAFGYGGMTPPNAPHKYDLFVFALDKELDLENGFFVNDLYHQMEDHIIEKVKISGIYNN